MIGIYSGIFSRVNNSRKIVEYTELLSMFFTLCFVTAPFTVFAVSLRNKEYNPISAYRFQFIIGTCCLALAVFRLLFFLVKTPALKRKRTAVSFVKDNMSFILFAGFILLACVSTWRQVEIDHSARWGNNTFFGTDFRREGIYTYAVYVLVFFTASMITHEFYKKIIVYATVGVSLFIALLAAAASYLPNTKWFLYVHETRALFGHSNHYGYYLSTTIMMLTALLISEYSLGGQKMAVKNIVFKVMAALAMTLEFVVLMNVDSLGAFLGVLGGMVFCGAAYSLMKGRVMRIIFAPITILAFVCSVYTFISQNETLVEKLANELPSDIRSIARNDENAWAAGTWRWYLWQLTAGKITERPFLGWGVEGIETYLKYHTDSKSDIAEHKLQKGGIERTHNEYLQYAAFFGIPALMFYVSAIVLVFLRGFMRRKMLTNSELCGISGAFGYLVNAMFGVSLFYTAPLMFVCLGLGVSRHRGKE
jgi:O-antigen ligase